MPAPAPPPATIQHTVSNTYPGHVAQASAVRAGLRALLGSGPVADQAILCASELAANAARHSHSCMPGGHFTVRITTRPGDHVQIEVTDDGGPWTSAHDGSSRHGLDILHALAADWGIHGDYRTRTVWARLPWPQNDPASRYAAPAQQPTASPDELPAAEASPAPAIANARCTTRTRWSAVIDGPRLRHLRRLHDLSQEKLAEQAGISVGTLARIERDNRAQCHPRTMTRLAAALGEHPATITRTITPATQRPAS